MREYREAEAEQFRLKRTAKEEGNFYVDAEPKLAFVIRIKGINQIAPKPRKILQLFRLVQINNGVFVRLNKATKQMLHLIQPWIAYGEPNLKSVRELLYKRGYAKINRSRIALSDNALIEDVLGRYGIISMEDLVHEIYTVGPHFKQVSNFLWPFHLNNPLNGFHKSKFIHFIEGGDVGDREKHINEYVLSYANSMLILPRLIHRMV